VENLLTALELDLQFVEFSKVAFCCENVNQCVA